MKNHTLIGTLPLVPRDICTFQRTQNCKFSSSRWLVLCTSVTANLFRNYSSIDKANSINFIYSTFFICWIFLLFSPCHFVTLMDRFSEEFSTERSVRFFFRYLFSVIDDIKSSDTHLPSPGVGNFHVAKGVGGATSGPAAGRNFNVNFTD